MTTKSQQQKLDSQDIITLEREDDRLWQQDKHRETGEVVAQTVYDLSVVVPTRNERDNIQPLLRALCDALQSMRVEVIFVDDSDDDTPRIIEDAASAMLSPLFKVQLEHRVAGDAREGGLATAVVHGINKAQGPYVAIVDADLQHPPEMLRTFYDQAVAQDMDLVLASRYIKGGSYEGLAGIGRLCISVGLKWSAKLLFPEQLMGISDPLGGFFLIRRSLLTGVVLRPIGYKILLEILMRSRWQQVLEVPYHFQVRASGESKANMRQGIMVLQHMQRLWSEVPAAGRVWKIGILLLINVLLAAALFIVDKVLPSQSVTITIVAFAATIIIDFLAFNRFVLPSPVVIHSATPSSQLPHHAKEKEKETGELTVLEVNLSDESHATQNGHTNGHRSVEEKETEKLAALEISPSDESHATQNGHTNGHHPVEEKETGELMATEALGHSVPHAPQKGRANGMLVRHKEHVTRRSRLAWLRNFDDWKKSSAGKIAPLIAIAVVVLAVVWISVMLPGALLIPTVLLIGATIVHTRHGSRSEAITMLLALSVTMATIDYVSWRFVVTNWHGWWISVPLLFAETLGALHTLGFQLTVWPWQAAKIARSDDPTQFPIFIFIPTVNEGVAILLPTLQGIIAARDAYLAQYPHGRVTIVVCNDGRVANAANWEDTETLAQELGVCCVTRTIRGGAKAGNIEHARQQLQATGDALLVIFDADQVAKPEFLLKTVMPFQDPKMGWVQTGQYYANLDNPVSCWADDQQSMFYNLLCPGKATLNSTFICGTNVVIRAAALDAIGGLPQDSVTEDFAASIALHSSWRSVYLTDVLATGLGPLDVPSYLKQQSRWAIGTMSVFRTHWRDLLLPQKHGLSIGQRLQYFLACTHYLCGLRDLIYLLSPMLFIFTGIPAVGGATLGEYLWHFLPYGLLSAIAMWYSSRGITGLRGIIIGFGSFPVLLNSLFSVILSRKVGFSVTSKQRSGKRSLSYLWVYCMFFLLCIFSLIWATQLKGLQQVSVFISAIWVVYSLLMLGSFLWLNFKDMRFQAAAQRANATSETGTNQSYPSKLLQRKDGLQPVWNLALAALIAVPILANDALGSFVYSLHKESTPFVLSKENRGSPYFGVSLPVQLLKQRTPVLERELNTRFSIIGRTQEIHDLFDAAWADQLAAQHARPWITLQFGVFGANNKPPLNANFPAIINGLHDQDLRRWAQDIRDYDKPVYLTLFLHADRNWSLSSGVANGGIPQDVARAWLHVQAVFHAAGANNVAWIWAPADPLLDQVYAPPVANIDAVLQSFIDYPGVKWGDPQVVLHNLVRRYPDKPLIVEASINGPAAQKAAWLTRLGRAVDNFPQVHALLYHEGGPGLKLTRAEVERWSLASDPASLAAMQHIVMGLQERAAVNR